MRNRTGNGTTVKRSQKIGLVLLGGLSTGLWSSCGRREEEPRITPAGVYATNQFIEGAGYYHAPYQAFYPRPYNFYDPERKLYYHGGTWQREPHRSIVNVSNPTPESATLAQTARDAFIQRAGFGSTSRGHFRIWS